MSKDQKGGRCNMLVKKQGRRQCWDHVLPRPLEDDVESHDQFYMQAPFPVSLPGTVSFTGESAVAVFAAARPEMT